MELKREFKKPDGWEPQYNVRDKKGVLPDPHRAEGALLNPLVFSHMTVHDTGATAAQHFSERLVKAGIEEGWISIKDGILTLYAKPENLLYTIVRTPGRYSCFDGTKLPDDDNGARARAYIAKHHAGEPSPDPNHPAGYECINYYDCVLSQEQHDKFHL